MKSIQVCEYGCGEVAQFQLKNGRWCCNESCNKCKAVKSKIQLGLKKAYATGKKTQKGFTESARQKSLKTRKKNSLEYFLQNPERFYNSESLKRYLLESGREYKCEQCGISSWQNKPITLEIDHIDGIRNHNYPENLRFLCPNCHSQTTNWRGRNINSGTVNISDDVFLKALHSCKNIRQALISLGLTPKGANYIRARKLMECDFYIKRS